MIARARRYYIFCPRVGGRFAYTHVCAYHNANACVHVFLCVFGDVCVYVYVHVRLRVPLLLHVYVHVYVHLYAHVYVHVYVQVFAHEQR